MQLLNQFSAKVQETQCAKLYAKFTSALGLLCYLEDVVLKEKNYIGYVYVVEGIGFGVYKIGRSLNPTERINRLETTLPFEIETILKIKTVDPIRLEKQIHQKFSDKRVQGEWFRLSEDDIKFLQKISAKSSPLPDMFFGKCCVRKIYKVRNGSGYRDVDENTFQETYIYERLLLFEIQLDTSETPSLGDNPNEYKGTVLSFGCDFDKFAASFANALFEFDEEINTTNVIANVEKYLKLIDGKFLQVASISSERNTRFSFPIIGTIFSSSEECLSEYEKWKTETKNEFS